MTVVKKQEVEVQADDRKLLYRGSTKYRKMKPHEKKRYHKWMKRLEKVMSIKISRSIGQENRCNKEEMMHELFLDVPNDRDKYDEYTVIMKKLFKSLKAQGYPYINCRGASNRGDWGYCIPDDLAFFNYDDFLDKLEKGINNERKRAEDVWKREKKAVKTKKKVTVKSK